MKIAFAGNSMDKQVIGWLEHVALPSLGLHQIKSKIDTGAQSSALHAEKIAYQVIDHRKYVFFEVTHESGEVSKVQAPFLEKRNIKSSSGHVTVRPVIVMKIMIGEKQFDTQFTLINRSMMHYKIIIGRDALCDRFVVDPARSYLLGA